MTLFDSNTQGENSNTHTHTLSYYKHVPENVVIEDDEMREFKQQQRQFSDWFSKWKRVVERSTAPNNCLGGGVCHSVLFWLVAALQWDSHSLFERRMRERQGEGEERVPVGQPSRYAATPPPDPSTGVVVAPRSKASRKKQRESKAHARARKKRIIHFESQMAPKTAHCEVLQVNFKQVSFLSIPTRHTR